MRKRGKEKKPEPVNEDEGGSFSERLDKLVQELGLTTCLIFLVGGEI